MNTLTGIRHKQRGAVLLVLFLTLFAAGATLFLSSVNTHTVEIRRHQDVRAELTSAKQALIAYAINYHTYGFDNDGDTFTDDEGPGRLICPDVDNDGLADTAITACTDYVRGRLPQSFSYSGNTFNLNNSFADIDRQFWYVVSPAFKEIAATDVNPQTAGDLSIDGKAGYIAVIIAPGEALAGQDRSSSQIAATNYLEQDNLSGTSFINSYPDNPDAFNDQVIGIHASELTIEIIEKIWDKEIENFPSNINNFIEFRRQELHAYYLAEGDLPTGNEFGDYIQNKGYGWLIDEGYFDTSYANFNRNTSYPYVRYNLRGCSTYWYWFIPVSPYSPNFTYVSGSPC
jgi:hypothetical protein